MKTVGAYQSGCRVLSDEDCVPLSLAVVSMCRYITWPKRENVKAGVASCLYKRSKEQEEYCNFEMMMIIALSACVGVSIRVSWCRRQRLVGK